MADIDSELAYLNANLELQEGEEIVGYFGGTLNGWEFDGWEGLLVATNMRLVYCSEPGFLSSGRLAWAPWATIKYFTAGGVNSTTRLFDGDVITFIADPGNDLGELNSFVQGQFPNVFSQPCQSAAQRGFEAMEQGRWDAGAAAFSEAGRQDERSALPDMYLSECLEQLDRHDEALAAAARAASKGCSDPVYLANVATRAHYFREEYAEAEREARRALDGGESQLGRRFLCLALRAQLKWTDALAAAEAGRKAFPEDTFFLSQAADICLVIEDAAGAEAAIEALSREQEVDPREVAAQRGRLLALRGNNSEASGILLKAFQDVTTWAEFDGNLVAAETLVNCFSSLKEAEKGLKFVKALQDAMETPHACTFLWKGLMLDVASKHQEAAKAIDLALADADSLRLDQQFIAMGVRAEACNRLGDHQGALRRVGEIRKFIKDNSDASTAFLRQAEYSLAAIEGEALAGLGRISEAAPLLRTASRSSDQETLQRVRELQDRLQEHQEKAQSQAAEAPEERLPDDDAGPSLSGRRDEALKLLKQLQDRVSSIPNQGALRDDARRLREDYGRAVVLAVMGEFNAGKSTFINAMLGQDLLPTDVLPTTATINVLKWGEQPGARIVWQDGSVEEIAMERLRQYVSEQKDAKENAVLRKIKYVEIAVPQEVLKRTWIVDTPGLNAIIPEHAEVTQEFMKQADAVLWLFRADQTGKKSELDALGTAGAWASKTLGVVNHIDRVPADEVDELLDGVRQDFGGVLGHVVGISAKRALEGQLAKDRTKWDRSGFPALLESLQRVVFTQSRPLKAASTLKKAITLVGQVERLEQDAVARHEARVKLTAQLKEYVQQQEQALELIVREQRGKVVQALSAASGAVATRMLDVARQRGWSLGDADVRYLSEDLHGRLGPALSETTARVAAKAAETLKSVEERWSKMDVGQGTTATAWQRFSIESAARLREHELTVSSVREYVRGRLDAGELRAVAAAASQVETGANERDVTGFIKNAYSFVGDKLANASSGWSKQFHAAAADAVEQAEEILREQHDTERQELHRPVIRLRKPLEAALEAIPLPKEPSAPARA